MLAVFRESFVAWRGLPFSGLSSRPADIIFLIPFCIFSSPFINPNKTSACGDKVLVSISEAVTSKATNDAQTDNSSFKP